MKYTLFLSLLLSAFVSYAQQVDPQKLDAIINNVEKSSRLMGTLAISKNGETLYKRTFGALNQEGNAYRIGSISKTFTAVLILQLVEQKKINLEDKVVKYFPKLPNAAEISIRQLMNHTSGVHDFTRDADFNAYMGKPTNLQEVVKRIVKAKAAAKPGQFYNYSNSNYVLLTSIVEKEYSNLKPFRKILDEQILQPLKLSNTDCSVDNALVKAKSYYFDGNWNEITMITDLSVPQGAGSLLSTAEDLNTFFTALLQGKILKPETVAEMSALGKGDYGLGIHLLPFYGRKGLGHGGVIDGYKSASCYFPSDSITVSYICNGVRYDPNDFMISVLSSIYSRSYTLPEFSNRKLDQGLGNLYTGVYDSEEDPIVLRFKCTNGVPFITQDGVTLELEYKGKNSKGEDTFLQELLDAKIVFQPDGKKFTLTQGGMDLVLDRRK